MSLFQSGPYQSKVLSFVVRQTQRWVDQGSVALRSLKITLSWTAQILLYPIYAVFQTVRLAGAKVQQVLELGSSGSNPSPTDAPESPTSCPTQPGLITADTPLEQVLQMIQGLELPVALPIRLPASSARSALMSSQDIDGSGANHPEPCLITVVTAALQSQDGAQAEATMNRATVAVRGIATLLDTRSLVLVTPQNQILDILNPDQQRYLQQRIIWEVAQYGRDRRIQQSTRRLLERLHVPAVADWLLASRQTVQRCLNGFRSRSAQPIPGHNSDLPIQQALLTVQEFSLSGRIPVLLPASDVQGTVVDTTPVLPAAGKVIHALPKQMQSGHGAVPLVEAAAVFIQGLATVLETRSLVLVTNQNQILNVLTAEQQAHIQQKIIWEVAHYGRYLQIRQATQRALSRVHPSPEDSPVLPPVRAFQQLMAWVQSGPVAIAANVFREAALPQENHWAPHSATALPPSSSPGFSITADPLRAWKGAQHHLARLSFSLANSLPVPRMNPATTVGAIALVPDFPLVPPVSPPVAAPVAGKQSQRKTALSPGGTRVTQAGIARRATEGAAVPRPEYIDTQATPVGYVQPLWKKFLRGLDQLLLWLESAIVALWKSLKRYL